MRFMEVVQRAEGGGWPLDNGNGMFTHGQSIIIIDRNEFLELIDDLRNACSQYYKHLDEIVKILKHSEGYRRSDGAYVVTRSIGAKGEGRVVHPPDEPLPAPDRE